VKPYIAIGLSALALSMNACTSTGASAFTLTTNTTLTANVALGAAVAIYLIYDPLAPNWEIEETRLPDDSYRLSMKMKRFHTGGSGEAIQVLKRRARQLQEEQGHAAYQIAGYSEGIDSQTLMTRRVAEGTIRFVKREDADSFALNGSY
jgi:hypothetical protein